MPQSRHSMSAVVLGDRQRVRHTPHRKASTHQLRSIVNLFVRHYTRYPPAPFMGLGRGRPTDAYSMSNVAGLHRSKVPKGRGKSLAFIGSGPAGNTSGMADRYSAGPTFDKSLERSRGRSLWGFDRFLPPKGNKIAGGNKRAHDGNAARGTIMKPVDPARTRRGLE